MWLPELLSLGGWGSVIRIAFFVMAGFLWLKDLIYLGDQAAYANATIAVGRNPSSAEACLALGKADMNKGRHKKAIADLTEALRLDPRNGDVYTNRGISYKATFRYTEAIADFTEALKLNPNNASGYAVRGESYYWTDGRQGLHRGRINPGVSFNYDKRADAYLKKGEKDNARRDLEKSLELYPGNGTVKNQLAALTSGAAPASAPAKPAARRGPANPASDFKYALNTAGNGVVSRG